MEREFTNVLIGDVGGTNVRFKILRLYHNDPEKQEVIKELTKFNPQVEKSFESCIKQYLEGLNQDEVPTIGVVGIAGAVIDNRVLTVNIPHWPNSNGFAIQEICGFDKFIFINDFIAAGYGISVLKDSDVTVISHETAQIKDAPHSVKIVIGPGTGLGQGVLVKGGDEKGLFTPFPAEGGHTDFSVRSKEDWELFKFAQDYIKNSNNIENRRCKRDVGRLSIESLCAGPAVPLIYAFMKKQYPDLPAVLEQDTPDKKGLAFDDIVSKDIISLAME